MISLSQLLTEGRLEDFKKKYAVLPDEVKDRIIKNDPSDNNKYLDWMGRVITSDKEANVEKVIKSVSDFDKYQASLGDINKFKTLKDLESALASRQKSKREQTAEGAKVLIDNDEFLVVAPTTHDSCRYYGNNTHWCIVGQESWWNHYYYDGTIIIVLDKRDNQKYAVVGRSDYGSDYDVYDRNDHRLNYSSFVGDPDDEDGWPEYVVDAIEDYMSSDDVEGRKSEYHEKVINTYLEDEGSDSFWTDYLEALHKEFDINTGVDLEAFKRLANQRGISNNDLERICVYFIQDRLNTGEHEDEMARIRTTKEVENSAHEYGEWNDPDDRSSTFLEYTASDYIRVAKGIDDYLDIVEQAVGEQVYDQLYYKGTLDDDIYDAITKYNNMLNSKQQQTFSTIGAGKLAVQIKDVNDIIYVLKRTGHEDMAYKIQSAIGLKESVIKEPDVIFL